MQFVQFLVTDDQTQKLRLATDMILQDDSYVLTEEETADYQRLSLFLGAVLQNPSAFIPTGARAAKVKSILRRTKAPETTPAGTANSSTNKRTQWRDKRIAAHKTRKARRKEDVAEFNRVQHILEAERVEAEEAHAELLARIENEPKFDIVDVTGRILLAGVPASMIARSDFKQDPLSDPASGQGADGEPGLSQIILPASAEKALERAG